MLTQDYQKGPDKPFETLCNWRAAFLVEPFSIWPHGDLGTAAACGYVGFCPSLTQPACHSVSLSLSTPTLNSIQFSLIQ